MAFSNNLQQLRKNANLSQEKLAEQLHITRQAVSKWESGQAVPDADTCLKLCEILGVSPNQLLLGDDSRDSSMICNNDEHTKQSGYVIFSIFMMLVLLCGTILLVVNLYNGHYFEPIIHIMSLFMICGSIIVFLTTTIIRVRRK